MPSNDGHFEISVAPESLGDAEFKRDYGLRYAYLAGAMYKGIASKELVVAMTKAGLMGFFGTGGLALDRIESAIRYIQREVGNRESYGMNLLSQPERPALEEQTVDLYLEYGVKYVEAAAFMRISPALVRYRLKGVTRNARGDIAVPNAVMAKVSRPEVAAAFMAPPPEAIVRQLVEAGRLTQSEAELSQHLPMANEICVEADSGGHTDQGVAFALLPAFFVARDEAQARFRYRKPFRIGAAGGIGTPHAAAAAFIMGADFVLTGSINQCTVEAGTSDSVKSLLQELNVHDTAYAPAGDMFEIGARVQVVKRGLFFPTRANKLYELYQRHSCVDEIEAGMRRQLEDKYFRRTIRDVWLDARAHWNAAHPNLNADDLNPKQQMATIFRWYFAKSTRLAMEGSTDQRVDYQIHCGPAMGSFNQWVKGTDIQPWQNRHVADIGIRLVKGAAELLTRRLRTLIAFDKAQDRMPALSQAWPG